MHSKVVSDPIPALQSFGYTEREAAFLYLVAVHSGYFLRRQFDYFIDRNKGSIAMRFLKKASAAGHIETFGYKQGWRVYHLCSRSVYRLVDDPESQLRRRKGDGQVRARLMALDYVLENDADHYLESEVDRLRFFAQVRRVSSSLFTDVYGRLYPLLSAFPIGLADREHPARSLVRFAFIDEGLICAGKFQRFLAEAEALMRGVGSFEVVYVAGSVYNFLAAKRAFWARFSSGSQPESGLFPEGSGAVARKQRSPLDARLTTVLLRYGYPTIRTSEARGSGRVRTEKDEEAASGSQCKT